MTRAYPYAEVEPDQEHWRRLDKDKVSPPDEDDRQSDRRAARCRISRRVSLRQAPHDQR
jgi:hypothetical protein